MRGILSINTITAAIGPVALPAGEKPVELLLRLVGLYVFIDTQCYFAPVL